MELGRVQGPAPRRVLGVGCCLGRRLAAAARPLMERGRRRHERRSSNWRQVDSCLRRRRMIAWADWWRRRAGWERMRSSRCCLHKACGPATRGRKFNQIKTAMLCWLETRPLSQIAAVSKGMLCCCAGNASNPNQIPIALLAGCERCPSVPHCRRLESMCCAASQAEPVRTPARGSAQRRPGGGCRRARRP